MSPNSVSQLYLATVLHGMAGAVVAGAGPGAPPYKTSLPDRYVQYKISYPGKYAQYKTSMTKGYVRYKTSLPDRYVLYNHLI